MTSAEEWSKKLEGALVLPDGFMFDEVQTDAIGACLLEIEVEAKWQESLGFTHEAAAVRKAAQRIKDKVMP